MAAEIRPDHVAAYIRWSTDDQSTGTTLDVQRDGCSHYVQSQGWKFREDLLFVDDGYSGGTLDRPAMQRLREAVRRHEVDCVTVYKIDRLSRNIVDATQLVLKEWRDRCHLKSVLEPIDTTTDLGRMIFGILAMFADFERSTIRERTHGGKTRRIRNGEQMHGRPAYGYAPHPTAKGQWVNDPEEAPIVQRMFRLAAEGTSATRILRLLNEEGARTRAGKLWSSPSVLQVLHNKTYCGYVEYGRTSVVSVEGADGVPATDSFSGKSRPPKKTRVVNDQPKVSSKTDAVTPMVDEETFDRVQVLLEGNRRRRYDIGGRAMGSPHLLVGIAQCSCGAPLIHNGGGGTRNPEFAGYYLCSGRRAGTCRESGYVPTKLAEAVVEQSFLALFGIREMRAEAFTPRMESADQDRAAVEAALETARRDMRRLEEEDQRLLRAARAGEVPFAALEDLRDSLRQDRNEADMRLRSLEEQRASAALRVRSFRVTLDALAAVDRWAQLEVWQKRQLLRMCLDGRITVVKAPHQNEIRVDAPWTVGG